MIDKLLKLADELDEKGQPIVADEVDKIAETVIEAEKKLVIKINNEKKEIHGGGVHIF